MTTTAKDKEDELVRELKKQKKERERERLQLDDISSTPFEDDMIDSILIFVRLRQSGCETLMIEAVDGEMSEGARTSGFTQLSGVNDDSRIDRLDST
jgi:hypothetical protein